MDGAHDPAVAQLAAWGLREGYALAGWSVADVTRSATQGGVSVQFRRGAVDVEVRLVRAGAAPYFRRVGAVDVSHAKVAPETERAVGELLTPFVVWLSERGAGETLPPLLADVPPSAPPRAAGAYETVSEPPPLDPATRVSPIDGFMRFETVGLDDLVRHPDVLREMYAGRFGGLVVRDVYDKGFMARLVTELAEAEARFPRTSFPERFRAHFYGRCLDGSDPELQEYLADADAFRRQSEMLFRGGAPFEARMEELFGAMAGGRRVELPRFRDGRAYTPATIRILLEGGQIGTHCGNEAATRPAYTHLNTMIDRGDQLSYFLTLQEPIAGGELIVYSLKWTDIDESRLVDGRSEVNHLLHEAQWFPVPTTAGDLLLFDGGRYFHRVAKVEGPRLRWTMGGFLMFDRSGERVLYWS
jgi:hapalindole-type alkaloid chlorinase